ncbi:hypothetical protein HDU93_000990 [Gonapodya sp. JEL0774]|nr:hypothetical protein HDU93_000990 [Gonapodya sp. JEL0774]
MASAEIIDAPTRTDTGVALSTSTAEANVTANYTVPADQGNLTTIDFGTGISSGALAGAPGAGSTDNNVVRIVIVVISVVVLCGFVAAVIGWWYIRQRKPMALYHGILPGSKSVDGVSTASTDGQRVKRIWDKVGFLGGSPPPEESIHSRSPSTTFATMDVKAIPDAAARSPLPPPALPAISHPLAAAHRDSSMVSDDLSDSSSSSRNGKSGPPRGVAPSPTPSARRARLADLIAPVPRGAFTPGPGSQPDSSFGSVGGASSESESEGGSRNVGPNAPMSDRVSSNTPSGSLTRKNALGKPYTVILPHKPHSPDEVALRRADAVFIFEVFSDSWAYGLNASTGREGVFPMSAVAQVGSQATPAGQGPLPASGSGIALMAVFFTRLQTTTVQATTDPGQQSGNLNASATTSTAASSPTSASTSAPTASPTPAVFSGRCGKEFGGATCPTGVSNLTNGYTPCCGADGFCGDSYFACGEGCQSGCDAFASPTDLTNGGTFALRGRSGVPAMHAILIPNSNNVIMLSKQEVVTEALLPDGRYAVSTEWNPATLSLQSLDLKTNPFCSGVGQMSDGSIISVGGSLQNNDVTVATGYEGIRILTRPCDNITVSCNWAEGATIGILQKPRWYPTMVNLPDGRMFVIGGIRQYDQGLVVNRLTNEPSYEFYPQQPAGTFQLDLLNAPNVVPFQLYPHVHVLRSGNLFIMAGMTSIILDPVANKLVKYLPDIPGINPRTYPAVGAATLLPISFADNYTSHVMICGGGHPDLWIEQPATDTCGIITPELSKPIWDMSEKLPQYRVMVHPTLLPDGSILFINGAKNGHQGFEVAKNPVFAPDLFIPGAPKGKRWFTLQASKVARMYHSISMLMPDATVLVTGSNPYSIPNTTGIYPTEYRNEIFTPPYLLTGKARPTFTGAPAAVNPGDKFTVTGTFDVTKSFKVSFYFPGGVTHALHMSTRLVLAPITVVSTTSLQITTPPDNKVVPAGYYLLYITNDGVPSIGQWIQIKQT